MSSKHFCLKTGSVVTTSVLTLMQVESFNSVLLPLRTLPPFTFFTTLQEYLMTKLSERRREAQELSSRTEVYVPLVYKHMRKILPRVRKMRVSESGEGVYIVKYKSEEAVVNLSGRSCSYDRYPQLWELPCAHFHAALVYQVFLNVLYVTTSFQYCNTRTNPFTEHDRQG